MASRLGLMACPAGRSSALSRVWQPSGLSTFKRRVSDADGISEMCLSRDRYQALLAGSPLNGPAKSGVIQPP